MATLDKLEKRDYEPKEWVTVNCPVCKSSRKKIYEKFGNKQQYTHNLCLDCELVYCSPRPKYDMDFLYNAYEFYADDHEVININNYNEHAKNSLPGITNDIKQYLSFDKKRTSFLDVGCATGEFLFHAKNYFQVVTGLEVSKKMASFTKNKLNINVITDQFENLSEDEKYSCIHMSHVIEHIPDPHRWLEKAKKILTDDGILVIKVPNIFSLDRKFKIILKRLGLRKGKWESWRTPDHLYEPSIPGFRKLFKLTNYEILSEYTYSRKNLASDTFIQSILYRYFSVGSNLHFIVRPID